MIIIDYASLKRPNRAFMDTEMTAIDGEGANYDSWLNQRDRHV